MKNHSLKELRGTCLRYNWKQNINLLNEETLISILPIFGCVVSRYRDHILTSSPNFPSWWSDIAAGVELYEELASKQFRRSFYWAAAFPNRSAIYQEQREVFRLSHVRTLSQSLGSSAAIHTHSTHKRTRPIHYSPIPTKN